MISNLAGAAETVELDQGQGRLSRIDAMQSQKMAEAQIRRARFDASGWRTSWPRQTSPTLAAAGTAGIPPPMPRLMARPDSVLCVSAPMPDGGDAETVLAEAWVHASNSSSS